MSQFFSDASFPERQQDDLQHLGRSQIGCRNGTYAKRLEAERQEYAAKFHQDVSAAVDLLGWEAVQTIIEGVKADRR